jgi:ABC-type multidrug transport system fused ATPase/permease subunit
MLWSVTATIWYFAPLLITFLSFVSYTLLEGLDLKPSVAFTALSLFGLLKVPLDHFADTLVKVQGSLASVRRIEEFLNEEETNKYRQLEHSLLFTDDEATTSIGFENATFSWDSNHDRSGPDTRSPFILKNIDVKFQIGRLNLIVGPTGSGKSSLIMALLGEMTLQRGKVYLPQVPKGCPQRGIDEGQAGSIAYCAQTPWLLNDTIRQNILFTRNYDEQRYNEVIACCALERDLELAPAGDLTFIGEKGISLSGGQKQRISLARAIYSSAEHILLDDCLSAVDSHTAKWIFDRCICGPFMQDRTCILATHNVALCIAKADIVVVLQDGEVMALGSSSSVIASGILGQDFKPTHSNSSSKPTSIVEDLSIDEALDGTDVDTDYQNGTSSKLTPDGGSVPLTDFVETKAEGHVKLSIFYKYLAASGGIVFWFSISMFFVAQLVGSIIINVWIREFSNAYTSLNGISDTTSSTASSMMHTSLLHQNLASIQPQLLPLVRPNTGPDVDLRYYLGVYGLLLLGFLFISFVRLVLIAIGSLTASRKLHDRLLTSIFGAQFAFFDQTPHGQIMNRFSKDIETVDQEIASMLFGTIHFVGSVICILVLIAIITPAFIFAGVFISLIYFVIGKLYINSSRDLKRIESVQRSPLYQHFSETLAGTVTIRAYGTERLFLQKNLDRVDRLNRPYICMWAVDRWLAFRLDVTGGLVAFFAGSLAILSIGTVDAGAVGLSLTYAITFSENILWLVRYHAANQQNFNS